MGVKAKHAYREEFLQSETWKDIRWNKLTRDGYACDICGIKDVLNDVHHVHYPNRWDETSAGDLVVLCRSCHSKLHLFPKEPQKTQARSWARYLEIKSRIKSSQFPLKRIDVPVAVRIELVRCQKVKSPERQRYKAVMARLFAAAGAATGRTQFNFRRYLREKIKESNHRHRVYKWVDK